jgi:undecaprenyl diphosphate synthase
MSINSVTGPTAAKLGGSGIPGLDHVAIIMDGNRRWAKERGMPALLGHQRGAEAVRRTIEACLEFGIPYLTLFAFSSENWRRPEDEVNELMNLLRFYIRRELNELARNGVQLRFLGEIDGLAPDIVELLHKAAEKTRHNSALTMTIALNYGGRRELVLGARRLAEQVLNGELTPDDIDESRFGGALNDADLPDPDLLIRTSGEQRISNFMLWQLAYTEFVFLPVNWPDFGKDDLDAAITEFQRRDRRYGASSG